MTDNRLFFLNFSWARIWQCLYVCMYVCMSVRKLWGSLETSKMVQFGWNFAHLFLGWISGGVFFIFQKFWFLGPGDEFFAKTRLKLRAAWRLQKLFDLAEILHTCSSGENLGVFLTFWKFWFLGPGLGPSPKMTEKLQGSLGGPKTIRFWWNFVHLFLKWIPDWSWASAVSTLLLGQPGHFKNCSIWLKFSTLVPQVNTWLKLSQCG